MVVSLVGWLIGWLVGCLVGWLVVSLVSWFVIPCNNPIVVNLYIPLISLVCSVRTASYGPSFCLPFMAQARSAQAMKTRKEKTRIHNLPYGPRTRLIRCLLYGSVDYSGFEKVIES